MKPHLFVAFGTSQEPVLAKFLFPGSQGHPSFSSRSLPAKSSLACRSVRHDRRLAASRQWMPCRPSDRGIPDISGMNGIEECKNQRSEAKHRQPGGEGGRDVFAVAQVFARETGRKEESAQHEAHAGAHKNVPRLIAEDHRQPEEDEN